jgi:hypothetical protein
MFNPQMVEHPGDYHVNEVIDRLWMVVETRAGRHDRRSRLVCGGHIGEVNR